MLTSLQIKNFKAWKNTGEIRLAPLTVIFGVNSAGKSSLGHLLLALKQTVLSTDRKRPLHLGDENSLIELGTFEECIHNHNIEEALSFSFSWKLDKPIEVLDSQTKNKFSGDELKINVEMKADKNLQPHVSQLNYELFQNANPVMAVKCTRDSKDKYKLTSSNYTFVRNQGRGWPLTEPDKFYRISDQSRAFYKNADFLSDFALQLEAGLSSLYYLGPLREHPKRIYSWSGDTPESVGQKGEFSVAAILAAKTQKRLINFKSKGKLQSFDELIATWLKKLGVINSFSVKPVAEGRKEYEVLVKTHSNSSEVKITDVGFGVSQVLPALVQAFYCPPNSTIWMEQPEIHLHPQVQSELADVFIAATKARQNNEPRNIQFIIESHSEHFLNRLLTRIAEEEITNNDVAIYFCKRSGETAELEVLELDIFGNIANWPDNFFGDEMAEITARTTAALNRKQKISKGEK